MSLTAGGVTLSPDSAIVPTDTTAVDPGDSGFDINTLINNSGDILTGAADVLAALNGKAIAGTSQTTQAASNGGKISNTTTLGNAITQQSNLTWILIAGGLVLVVVLYMIFGKK